MPLPRTVTRAIGVLAGFVLALALLAPSAGATTQILGQATAGNQGVISCAGACMFVQKSSAAGSPSYTVPAGNWIITGWKHQSASPSGGNVRLVVFDPTANANEYIPQAISDPVNQTSNGLVGPDDGGVRIPVDAGDVIGADFSGNSNWYHSATGAGNTVARFDNEAVVGTAQTTQTPDQNTLPPAGATLGVNIRATIESDGDNDGFEDSRDNCPAHVNPTQVNTDGDAEGNICDDDDDNDGDLDGADNCHFEPNADQANADGDSLGDACDIDDDNDGQPDTGDNCRTVVNPNQANVDGDTLGDACDDDNDNDGVKDGPDNCRLTPNADQANTDGDAQGNACDNDDDNDTKADGSDNCSTVANADQVNSDGDSVGDACDDDDDNDGAEDSTDNCRIVVNGDQVNGDGDAQGDACDDDDDNDGLQDGGDNCRTIGNVDQADVDADTIGDVCDPDNDNDTVANGTDNCALLANTDQVNSDGDAQGDACDPDDDNDTVADGADNCALIANADQANTDGDAQGNACDGDDDNDGVADAADAFPNDPSRSSAAGPPDTGPAAAPTLSALKLGPRSFAAAKRRGGTTVSYKTSQDSTTTLSVLRSSKGVRKGGRCVKASKRAKGKRCTRLVLLRPALKHADKAGSVSFAFNGRLGRKALRPGSYVLRARGENAKGKGNTVKTTFKVVRG